MKPYTKKFYASQAWKDCREAYIATRFYICERCDNPAEIVHHVIPITPRNIHDPMVTLCFDNLMALCADCHNTIHKRKHTAPRYTFDHDGNIAPPPIPKP
jgi:5-methylcytosine-specific restriction endonuclease McrA